MRIALLPLAALLFGGCPAERDGAAQPSNRRIGADIPFADANELIPSIEARIVMPEGAGPLDSYTRTYSRGAAGMPAQDGYVYGVLDRTTPGPRVARWSEAPVAEP